MKTLALAFGRFCSLGVLFVAACASSPPPPADAPPPAFDEPATPAPAASEAVKPSSKKVEEAMDAIKAQDFEKAKALLTDARAQSPKDPQAAFYLGVALEGLSDAAGAAKSYKDALALDPKLTDAAVNLSALSLDAKDAAGALAAAETGLKSAPKQPDLLLNRALALEALDRKDDAVKAYGQAVAASPDNIDLRVAYAELLAPKDEKAALEQLRAVSTTSDPQELDKLAQKFGSLHAFADCIGVLDKAIKTKDIAALHVRRAVCRHGQKDDAGALADYEAAIKLDDKFAPAHYYLAKHVCPKDKKKAAEHFKRAAELVATQDIGKRSAELAVKAKAGKCE